MTSKMLRTVLTLGVSLAFFSLAQPAQSARYAVVEQWSGARHRMKRVPIDSEPRDIDPDDRDAAVISPDGRWQTPEPQPIERGDAQQFQRGSSQHVQRNDAQQFGNGNNRIPQPDSAALNPAVDAEGIRHFSNGKHFDLSKMSVDQAVENTGRTELGESPKMSRSPDFASNGFGSDDNQARPRHRRHRRGNPNNTTYTAWW